MAWGNGFRCSISSFFVTTLILQRQTGANMVQVLENLSMLVARTFEYGGEDAGAHRAAAFFPPDCCAACRWWLAWGSGS